MKIKEYIETVLTNVDLDEVKFDVGVSPTGNVDHSSLNRIRFTVVKNGKGEDMKILQENVCDLPNCDCGWNIMIGGKNKKDLKAIKAKVKELKKER